MRASLYLLGWLWALPTTFVGALVALLGLSAPVRLDRGVLWVVPRGPVLWALARAGMAAMTLGCVVLLVRREYVDNVRLVSHERRHVLQAMVCGVGFLPAYGIASVLSRIATGKWYRFNLFEIDARRAEVRR